MNAAGWLRRLPGSLSILVLALLANLFASPAVAEEAPPADTPVLSADALALAPDSTADARGVNVSPAADADHATATEAPSTASPSSDAKDVAVPASAAPTTVPSIDDPPAAKPAAAKPPTSKPHAAKTSRAKSQGAKSSAARTPKPGTPVATDPPRNGAAAVMAEAAVRPASTGNETTDERSRVEQGLARTASVLRTVEAKVRRSFNKKAREDFDRARGLQKEANDALDQNLYARADRLTQEARALARQIAVHLGPPQDDPDYVAAAMDRTDDAMGRAKEVLKDAGGASERSRLDKLQDKQAAARRLLKEGSTRDAYALTREVRDGVLTLLRDCDDLPVAASTAERALKRADRALEQVKSELGERPTTNADRFAKNAREQMSKAHAAFARKNYRDTLIYSKLAERDLELAVNAQRGTTSRSG